MYNVVKKVTSPSHSQVLPALEEKGLYRLVCQGGNLGDRFGILPTIGRKERSKKSLLP